MRLRPAMKTSQRNGIRDTVNALDASRLSRRTVMKWFAAAAGAANLPDLGPGVFAASSSVTAPPTTHGYGTDPDVSGYYKPGDFWPLTLTAAQRETAISLADVILPADHLGPAASDVRVTDFLDEWLSAPYPAQQKDRTVIMPGLQWLEEESQRRFQTLFKSLGKDQQHVICDDICWPADAAARFKKAAEFFVRFRTLAASAYYSTEAGWKALGYVGNVAMTSFDGPPPEVLTKLGIEQTVK